MCTVEDSSPVNSWLVQAENLRLHCPLSASHSTRGGSRTHGAPQLSASHVAQPGSQGAVPRGGAGEEGLGREDARAGRSAPARGGPGEGGVAT